MPKESLANDSRYDSLPFPIRNGGRSIEADPETLMKQGTEFFGSGNHANRRARITPKAEMWIVSTGKLQFLCFKSTPCITREEGSGDSSTLAMPYAGGIHRFRDGTRIDEIAPGDIHLNPRNGGTVTVGYFSGLIARIEHRQLKRTMLAMSGSQHAPVLDRSLVIRGETTNVSSGGSGKLWSFIQYVDNLLKEDEYLPAALGLDEQVYRLLAIVLLEKLGIHWKNQKRRSSGDHAWTSAFDELIDYIRSNIHLNLSLTDLEERSHYSARRLQYLFRDKFNCTPMQFIRRQKLASAMERLQTADWGDTVTAIGRDCGYRFTSNFSSDFHREFGVAPSVVLRASRTPRNKV